jgi:hypothetical protein
MHRCQVKVSPNRLCNKPAFRGCEHPKCGKPICDSAADPVGYSDGHQIRVGYPFVGDLHRKHVWCIDCYKKRKSELAEQDRRNRRTGWWMAGGAFGLSLTFGLAALLTSAFDSPTAAAIFAVLAGLFLIFSVWTLKENRRFRA